MVYRADLHIHTVLSPCGDLEMSPINIVNKAKDRGLDIIGVTDHNSTLHGALVRKLAEEKGIYTLTGVEVTSREEVHCLAFFENDILLQKFQQYIDKAIMRIPNNIEKFGYQVVVDEDEQIIEQVEHLLIVSIDKSIEEIEQKVHELGGIFVLAHIDKKKNSIMSQLGFIPADLNIEGIEFSKYANIKEYIGMNKYLEKYKYIQSSDAHYLNDVGSVYTEIECSKLCFKEIKEWFRR